VRGIPVTYDVEAGRLGCLDKTAPLGGDNGGIRLEMLVDRTSIEVFANGGRIYMPIGVIPPDEGEPLAMFAEAGAATIDSLEIYELRSAWE
jgi:sucrose-6-phosphate hydrolase SacC (GH32 family)